MTLLSNWSGSLYPSGRWGLLIDLNLVGLRKVQAQANTTFHPKMTVSSFHASNSLLSEPKYSIALRNEIPQMGQTQVPGPGHYDQNADSVYLSSPQNSFPKAGREALNANERQNFPGPG